MIYLVRQGQTDWNLQKRFNGRTETELNQTGIAQARRRAESLADVQFDACFCSPQRRARQTCEMIYAGPIAYDERLLEIYCGEFEGTEETAESMNLFLQASMRGDRGTERYVDFMKRNCDFCDMVAEEYNGTNVLIVTHAANVRVINYYFLGKPKDYDFSKPISENGGLLTYEN